MSMNTHQIRHLPAEVMKFGPLDSFACWKFENCCKRIGELHCSTKNPLVGLKNRLKTTSSFNKGERGCWPPKLSETVGERHYKIKWTITLSNKDPQNDEDKYFLHTDGTVCKFWYAYKERDTIKLAVQVFVVKSDNFALGQESEFKSSNYGIWRLSHLPEYLIYVNIENVANKVVVQKRANGSFVGYKLLGL